MSASTILIVMGVITVCLLLRHSATYRAEESLAEPPTQEMHPSGNAWIAAFVLIVLCAFVAFLNR